MMARKNPDARAADVEPFGAAVDEDRAVVQTVTIVYASLHGVPLGRADRPLVGWYGDMEMQSHAWDLLKAGPLDVIVKIGPPVPLAAFADRKQLAERTERAVREELVRTLRAWPAGAPLSVAAPPRPVAKASGVRPVAGKWR